MDIFETRVTFAPKDSLEWCQSLPTRQMDMFEVARPWQCLRLYPAPSVIHFSKFPFGNRAHQKSGFYANSPISKK